MDSPDSIDGLFDMHEMDGSYKMNLIDEPSWLEDLIKNPLLADDFLNSTGDVFDLDLQLDSDGHPLVYSEHSYSVNGSDPSLMGAALTTATVSGSLDEDTDLESALLTLVDPNLMMTPDDSVANESTEYMDYYVMNSSEYIDYTSGDANSENHACTSTDSLTTLDSDVAAENIDFINTDIIEDSVEYNNSDASMSEESVEITQDGNTETPVSLLSSSSNVRRIPVSNIITSSAASSLPASTIVLTYQPNNAIKVSGKTPTIIVTKSTQSGLMVRQAATLPVGFVRVDSSTRSTASRGAVVSGISVSAESTERRSGVQTTVATAGNSRRGLDARLPPSPPNSDSEGMSPRADHPPSPPRQPSSGLSPVLIRHQQRGPSREAVVSILNPSVSHIQRTSNGYHISPTGRLILTEEERRTLISEGYSVPSRLPLSKQEEMNLKKIQRKIKNKMSAQESRRKKKDYLDSLEKKLDLSNQENQVLKKQLEALQSDNKSLQAQINKLQQLANRLKPSIETSTCVMVFALFFAMFTSTFLSPAYLTSGQMKSPWSALSGSSGASVSLTHKNLESNLQASTISDDYRTPNMKSRTLMSTVEDPPPDDTSHHTSVMFPSCYLLHWLSGKPALDEPSNSKSEPLSTVQPPNHQLIIESKIDHIIGTAQTPSLNKHDPELSTDNRGSGLNDSVMFEATATAADVIVYTTSGAANLSDTPELRTVAV